MWWMVDSMQLNRNTPPLAGHIKGEPLLNSH
jgi:hypothetical protein